MAQMENAMEELRLPKALVDAITHPGVYFIHRIRVGDYQKTICFWFYFKEIIFGKYVDI